MQEPPPPKRFKLEVISVSNRGRSQQETAEWKGIIMEEEGVLYTVLSFLDVSDVTRSKRVNKQWKRLCERALDEGFLPKLEFQSNPELREAIKRYCQYKRECIDDIGRTYGYPIGKWRVGKLTDFSHCFWRMREFNESSEKNWSPFLPATYQWER